MFHVRFATLVRMEQVAPFLSGLGAARPKPGRIGSYKIPWLEEPDTETGTPILGHAGAILGRLSETESLSVDSLRSELALPLGDFSEATNALIQAQLVQIEGQPGNEIIRLSPTGSALTQR